MLQKLRSILLFDTSSIRSLQNVRAQIMEDNRKFAVRWSLAQFFYGTLSLIISFRKETYAMCRSVYIAVMIVSFVAFVFAEFWAKKKAPIVYISMLFNDVSLFGAGLLNALILLQNGGRTFLMFAAALIVPAFFVNNTLLNIMIAILDFVAAVVVLTNGLPQEIYGWCLTDLIIFSSMGVLLGHFINKSRFERYVFAESAVQLAESNAKLAELQTKFAYYDQMTELKNRRAYSEKIEELEKDLPRDFCVVAADINGLKQTNDTLGHEAGDELIVGAADCLRRSFEGTETIYRLGGDEFCVITGASPEEVEESLAELEKISAGWKGQYINGISLSYGFASGGEFDDLTSILKMADRRMYSFKARYYEATGRDRRKM